MWREKKTRIFVLGHYLFFEGHSFPRATLSENCSLLGTDINVRGQISYHTFAPNGGYCLFIRHYSLFEMIGYSLLGFSGHPKICKPF